MRFRASRIILSAASLASALLLALPVQVRAEETKACFDANGSIKEVLDACAAYISSGSTDNDLLIKAHGIRAMALAATGDVDAAIAEMDAAAQNYVSKASTHLTLAA